MPQLPISLEELAADPAVRAAVLATVTLEEAARTIRTRAGKPWCDAFLIRFADTLDDQLDEHGAIGSGARQVVGVPSTWTAERPQPAVSSPDPS